MFSKIFSQEGQLRNFLNQYSDAIKNVSGEFSRFLGSFDPVGVASWAGKIKDMETRCDKITHDTLNWLRRTFVVNYDREDIHHLASNLDDIVDLMNACATRISLYGLKKMNPDIAELSSCLRKGCDGVANVIVDLVRRTRDKDILAICKEVKDAEEEGDRLYHQSLANLYTNGTDPLEVMKWKEILDGLEQALDKCNAVTNIIEGIVLKYH